MKKSVFIGQLEVGQNIDDIFVLKAVKEGETRAGKPFLFLTFMDKSGEISGPIWDDVEKMSGFAKVSSVVHCRGKVVSFRDQKQVLISFLEPVDPSEVDMSVFFRQTRGNREKMAKELQVLLATVEDRWFKRLLAYFFGGTGPVWGQFQTAAAAKGAHHAYIGGLLEHSLSVAKVCDSLATHYPGIDRDLLLSGALLHDIGKLKEMTFKGTVVEYTSAGRLKGHLVLGSEMIAFAASNFPDFPEEKLLQLEHLILSHHGRLDFGSPVVPITPEAFLLNMADDIDAKMNMIEDLRWQLSCGEFSVTEYQRLLERFLYLKGYEEAERAKIEGNSVDGERRDMPHWNQPSLF